MKKINKLCKPAYVYLVISVLSLTIMIIENIGNTNTFKFGNYEQRVSYVFCIYCTDIICDILDICIRLGMLFGI